MSGGTEGGQPGAGAGRLTHSQFRALYGRLKRETARGPGDRRGALAEITPERVLAAAREVRLGRTVSLEAPVRGEVTPDNPDPARRELIRPSAAQARQPGLSFALDRLAMNVHGDADSHLDALSHVILDGALYNDVPAGRVRTGDSGLSVETAAGGIVGRGVLLDIPRLRGTPWLEPGDAVSEDDLLGAERAQQVAAGPGDLLLVRVGHRRRRRELGPWDAAARRAGLRPSAMTLLAARRVAALGGDGNNDTAPSLAEGAGFPVHALAVTAMGLHLMDYLDLEELAETCAAHGRWSFLCVVAPLRVAGATGSPVNPIAIL